MDVSQKKEESLFSKAIQLHRRFGIRAGVVRIFKFLWRYPRAYLSRSARASIDTEFDSEFGVSTGGILNLKDLSVVGSADNATAYQAIFPKPFRQVMEQLPIDFANSTFIDFGSGKGRAVLLAATYPFRSIIGVEFAAELHSIAEQNLQAVKSKVDRLERVKLHCADALRIEIPETPIVAFFYNPFGKAVMEPIVRNLEQSFSSMPREIWVIYFWPDFAQPWEQSRFSEVLITQPNWPTKSTTQVVRVWRLNSA